MKDYVIRRAAAADVPEICAVTKRAFAVYADALDAPADVSALHETADEVNKDIAKNNVFVAVSGGAILGSIRWCALSDSLAYIYRFGVDPSVTKAGIGSDLLKAAVDDCQAKGFKAVALHTNSKYYSLARYYYGKQFYVHSVTTDRGYLRALFIKELTSDPYDVSPAYKK
ncbi:MAG: GNAT family N-acetyltransferase [Clostridiales bacterium]|jgi:predicted N-acetyltransferase YhbS|nr:GNAT family N-acetyltransferase [Clostridiales bacterium]